jgi:hypothetical protein
MIGFATKKKKKKKADVKSVGHTSKTFVGWFRWIGWWNNRRWIVISYKKQRHTCKYKTSMVKTKQNKYQYGS